MSCYCHFGVPLLILDKCLGCILDIGKLLFLSVNIWCWILPYRQSSRAPGPTLDLFGFLHVLLGNTRVSHHHKTSVNKNFKISEIKVFKDNQFLHLYSFQAQLLNYLFLSEDLSSRSNLQQIILIILLSVSVYLYPKVQKVG